MTTNQQWVTGGAMTTGTAEAEQQAIGAGLASPVRVPEAAFWSYRGPGLVLGRGQKPIDDLLARARDAQLEVTRRHTGGGAVLSGNWMMSQYLVLPPDHPVANMSLPDSFEWVGGAWRRALAKLAVPTRMVDRSGLRDRAAQFRRSDVGWVCFAGLSYGELTDDGNAKILGLAQVRRKNGIVVVAGLLLERPPWETLVRVWLGEQDADLAARIGRMTATCRGLAGEGARFDTAAIAAAVMREMQDPGTPSPGS